MKLNATKKDYRVLGILLGGTLLFAAACSDGTSKRVDARGINNLQQVQNALSRTTPTAAQKSGANSAFYQTKNLPSYDQCMEYCGDDLAGEMEDPNSECSLCVYAIDKMEGTDQTIYLQNLRGVEVDGNLRPVVEANFDPVSSMYGRSGRATFFGYPAYANAYNRQLSLMMGSSSGGIVPFRSQTFRTNPYLNQPHQRIVQNFPSGLSGIPAQQFYARRQLISRLDDAALAYEEGRPDDAMVIYRELKPEIYEHGTSPIVRLFLSGIDLLGTQLVDAGKNIGIKIGASLLRGFQGALNNVVAGRPVRQPMMMNPGYGYTPYQRYPQGIPPNAAYTGTMMQGGDPFLTQTSQLATGMHYLSYQKPNQICSSQLGNLPGIATICGCSGENCQ